MLEKDTYTMLGNYRGKVVDATDPKEAGRIKVAVYNTFEGIQKQYLPWAVPAMPIHNGASTSGGYFAVPKVGSDVWVFFESGDIYQPVYFAEAQTDTKGIPTEAKTNYPDRIVKKSGNITVTQDNSNDSIIVDHPKMSLLIDTSGNINITSDGNVTISADGEFIARGGAGVSSMTLADDGIVTLAGTEIHLNAP